MMGLQSCSFDMSPTQSLPLSRGSGSFSRDIVCNGPEDYQVQATITTKEQVHGSDLVTEDVFNVIFKGLPTYGNLLDNLLVRIRARGEVTESEIGSMRKDRKRRLPSVRGSARSESG